MDVEPIPSPLPAAATNPDDQLITLWLHGRSKHTQRAYLADIERFRARAGKSFAAVTLVDLQTFAASLETLSPATAYRTLSAIKSLLAFGHRIGLLSIDVGRILRLPRVRNRLAERILSDHDLHRILSLETDPRNRAILSTLYMSGIRVSELCGLTWRDLQPSGDSGQITVFGKGDVTRSIRLPAPVWEQLLALRPSDVRTKERSTPPPPRHPSRGSQSRRPCRCRATRLSPLVPARPRLARPRPRRPDSSRPGHARTRQYYHYRPLSPRTPTGKLGKISGPVISELRPVRSPKA
jgi:integrase